jgi:hypothetical protein
VADADHLGFATLARAPTFGDHENPDSSRQQRPSLRSRSCLRRPRRRRADALPARWRSPRASAWRASRRSPTSRPRRREPRRARGLDGIEVQAGPGAPDDRRLELPLPRHRQRARASRRAGQLAGSRDRPHATARSPTSSPRSAPGSPFGTTTPSPTPGARAPARSSTDSPPTASEATTRVTRYSSVSVPKRRLQSRRFRGESGERTRGRCRRPRASRRRWSARALGPGS